MTARLLVCLTCAAFIGTALGCATPRVTTAYRPNYTGVHLSPAAAVGKNLAFYVGEFVDRRPEVAKNPEAERRIQYTEHSRSGYLLERPFAGFLAGALRVELRRLGIDAESLAAAGLAEKYVIEGAITGGCIALGNAPARGSLSFDFSVAYRDTGRLVMSDRVSYRPTYWPPAMIPHYEFEEILSQLVLGAIDEMLRQILAQLPQIEARRTQHAQAQPRIEQPQQEATAPAAPEESLPSGLRKRFAVVVGISSYQDSGENGFGHLSFADDDAADFAAMLKQLGWTDSHIKLLLNQEASKSNVQLALESWLTKAGPDDIVVLFWSGHGFPDPQDPEKVYFACYDTRLNLPASGYRMDRVRLALEECHAKNVIVLADTCHAGKLITRGDPKGLSILPNIERMRREQDIPAGWVFMVAADTDRLAVEDSSWSNGAFTHCLLAGLSGEADGYEGAGPTDGFVTLGELRTYLNSKMPDETLKALGSAIRPLVTTSTADPSIWELSLAEK